MTSEEKNAPGRIFPAAFESPQLVGQILASVSEARLVLDDNGRPVICYWR